MMFLFSVHLGNIHSCLYGNQVATLTHPLTKIFLSKNILWIDSSVLWLPRVIPCWVLGTHGMSLELLCWGHGEREGESHTQPPNSLPVHTLNPLKLFPVIFGELSHIWYNQYNRIIISDNPNPPWSRQIKRYYSTSALPCSSGCRHPCLHPPSSLGGIIWEPGSRSWSSLSPPPPTWSLGWTRWWHGGRNSPVRTTWLTKWTLVAFHL